MKYHNMYIIYIDMTCIHSVSRNTDTHFQSDAKEPVLLIKLPKLYTVKY